MKTDVICTIEQEDFATVPAEYRAKFGVIKIEPDDRHLYKDDEEYKTLRYNYMKASKALRDFLYEQRNKK